MNGTIKCRMFIRNYIFFISVLISLIAILVIDFHTESSVSLSEVVSEDIEASSSDSGIYQFDGMTIDNLNSTGIANIGPISQGQSEDSRLSLAQYFSQYFIPMVNPSGHLERWLDNNNDDITGYSDLMISNTILQCVNLLENDSDLDELKQRIADSVLAMGGSNGEVLTSVAQYEKHYSDCKRINEIIPDHNYYKYMQHAASLNNAAAQFELATAILPPKFDSWDEIRKAAHRENMGKLLTKAQKQCELQAFQAFAYPNGFGMGYRWDFTLDPDIPLRIKAYGNLVASTLLLSTKFIGTSRWVNFNREVLSKRALALSPFELEQAKSYGQELFYKFCSK